MAFPSITIVAPRVEFVIYIVTQVCNERRRGVSQRNPLTPEKPNEIRRDGEVTRGRVGNDNGAFRNAARAGYLRAQCNTTRYSLRAPVRAATEAPTTTVQATFL